MLVLADRDNITLAVAAPPSDTVRGLIGETHGLDSVEPPECDEAAGDGLGSVQLSLSGPKAVPARTPMRRFRSSC
jgi:hypothetical protein